MSMLKYFSMHQAEQVYIYLMVLGNLIETIPSYDQPELTNG